MKFPITLPWVVLLLINVAIIVILGFVSRQLFDVKSCIQLQDAPITVPVAVEEPEIATAAAEPSPTPKAKKIVKKMVEVEVEE